MSSTAPETPGLAYHPLAELFPLLQGREFDELVEDIRVNGVREPVWTYQGQLLDGRNRHRAASVAGREAPTREFTGDDPLAFVISLNLHRRHLDESQRSVIAAKIATMSEGRPSSESAPIGAVSQTQAAELMKVGRRSVQRAKKVLKEAAPELVKAVERGEVKVDAAAAVVSAPKEAQAQAAAQGARAVKELKRTIAKPRAATLKDDLRKAIGEVRHFVEVLRAAKVKPAKFILEPYAMSLMEPKGELVTFVKACAKAVAAHDKANRAEIRKRERLYREQRKRWRAKMLAKKRAKAAASARRLANKAKRAKAAKTAKPTKAPVHAGRVSARQHRAKSSGANRLSHASSRGLRRSSVSA